MRLDRCASCVTSDRRSEAKRKLVAMKGGKCERCGYDKHINALSFHHRDPSKKLHPVLGSNNKSWAASVAEAEKCDLLCANCHIEVHAEMAAYASGEAASLSMT